MNEISEIISIIKETRNHINDSTDVIWTNYKNAQELQNEMDNDIQDLENGKLISLEKYKMYFLPTATFQEISIANGWSEEYMKLAEKFDELYEKTKRHANTVHKQ